MISRKQSSQTFGFCNNYGCQLRQGHHNVEPLIFNHREINGVNVHAILPQKHLVLQNVKDVGLRYETAEKNRSAKENLQVLIDQQVFFYDLLLQRSCQTKSESFRSYRNAELNLRPLVVEYVFGNIVSNNVKQEPCQTHPLLRHAH